MATKIIKYDRETKEEQEEYWKTGDKLIARRYERNKDIDYSKEKDKEGYIRMSLEVNIKRYVLHNKLEWAKEAALNGITLINSMRERIKDPEEKKYAYISYFADYYFILDKKKHDEYLKLYTEHMASSNIKMDKYNYLSLAIKNLKCGNFDIAMELMKNVYTKKTQIRFTSNIIYQFDKLFYYVTEYLCDKEKNSHLLPKLTESIKLMFDEEQKGNKKLLYGSDDCVYSAIREGYLLSMRYIWYKYFSGRDWDTISSVEIIQSIRYGVKGLQDC